MDVAITSASITNETSYDGASTWTYVEYFTMTLSWKFSHALYLTASTFSGSVTFARAHCAAVTAAAAETVVAIVHSAVPAAALLEGHCTLFLAGLMRADKAQ